jgi:hypothetical protein
LLFESGLEFIANVSYKFYENENLKSIAIMLTEERK